MSNNRMYLRCKKCGEIMSNGYYYTKLEDKLNNFLMNIKEYNKNAIDYCDTKMTVLYDNDTIFKIAYEIDELNKNIDNVKKI